MRKIVSFCSALVLMLLLQVQSFAQEINLSGTILADEDGTPLVGVTVTNKATGKKTQTNSVGFYTIAASKGNKITFSYVGYANAEYIVGSETKHSIRLVESNKEVGNVVVTAFGATQSKRNTAYQTVTVSGDEITSTRRENFINSLAGRIPGAMITSTTGMPGSSTSIILRGPTSMDGSNQPIFVVDGLIIDNNAFEMQDRLLSGNSGLNTANRNNDFANRAADINPEDIESLTVLKGPEATALYGIDGANGAIVIVTKKGKKGKANVTYNGNVRFDFVNNLPKTQNVFDQGSGGITNPTSRSFFGQRIPAGRPLFDNINNFFRTGVSQQHNVAVDGGTDAGSYRFSASYFNNQGVVPTTNFSRYNFTLRTAFKLSPKLNVNNSVSYISTSTIKASKGVNGFLLSLLTWPNDEDITNYLDANGNRITINPLSLAEDNNPFFELNMNRNFDNNTRLLANTQIVYDAAKWLNLTGSIAIDYYNNTGTIALHPQDLFGRNSGGFYQEFSQEQQILNGFLRAVAKKKIGNFNHTVTFNVDFMKRFEVANAVAGERIFDPKFFSINNTDPISRNGLLTPGDNFNRAGAFLQYAINYKNFLNLSLTGRVDGSSKLINPVKYNASDPFVAYWTGNLSFVFSDAFKLPKQISYGQFRMSYATTGRDPRSAYVKGNRFTSSTFTGGGFAPFVTQGNPDLRPEFSKNFEVGGVLKFFKNRISLDVAYYQNRTSDQIINPRLSYASGAILKWMNGGTVENSGYEAILTAKVFQNKKFSWDVSVNFARNRNLIVAMPAGLPTFYNSDTWVANIRNIATKGGNAYTLAANRYQRNTNGDILISPTTGLPLRLADYTPVADRQPDFTIGFQNSFQIGDVGVSFLLDIRRGGDVWNGTEQFLYSRGRSLKTLDRETPRIVRGVLADGLQNTANPTPNTIVITPLFRSDFYTAGFAEEDFIERDVHWVRLRDVTISYKLADKLIKKQRIFKSASVFVTGTDLFIITNYSGADPSANANNVSSRAGIGGIGMDYGNIPNPRGLSLGLRCTF